MYSVERYQRKKVRKSGGFPDAVLRTSEIGYSKSDGRRTNWQMPSKPTLHSQQEM